MFYIFFSLVFIASVAECALCKSIISVVDELLDNPTVDDDIKQTVSKVCKYIPASKQSKVICY